MSLSGYNAGVRLAVFGLVLCAAGCGRTELFSRPGDDVQTSDDDVPGPGDVGGDDDVPLAPQAPTDGLIHHWPLDATYVFRDAVGTADCSNPGFPARSPNGGAMVYIDGASADCAPFPLANMTAITYSAWLKTTSRNNAVGFGAGSGYPLGAFIAADVSFPNGMRCTVSDGTARAEASVPTGSDGNTSWHHIVCRFDASATNDDARLRMTIDGVPQGPFTYQAPTAFPASVGTWHLGTYTPEPQYSSGGLADVRIYDRALSDQEVSDLFRATGGDLLRAPSADVCAGVTAPGGVCSDGTVYAGADSGYALYTTPCDLGQTFDGATCTGTPERHAYNNGNTSGFTLLGNWGVYGRIASRIAALADADAANAGMQPHQSAVACSRLRYGGHDDWYVPDAAELTSLYNNRDVIGRFDQSGVSYASITEGHPYEPQVASNLAIIRFSDGYTYADGNGKPLAQPIRCVRTNP